MSAFLRPSRRQIGFLILTFSFGGNLFGASVEEALKLVPVQRDVEIDRPSAKEIESCSVETEQINGSSALIVRGAGGQVLRAFVDTNKDSNLDQWSYYLNGIESYRDVDSNFDGKPDQYRWVGLGGTKWGIDKNQDGQIDEWKSISAEEVSFEVLAAIRDQDAARFQRLLLSKTELDALGVGKDQYSEMARNIGSATSRFASAVKSQRDVDARSRWVHFGATRPCVVPAGTTGNQRDLHVYENVSAMMENAGKHGQLGIGAMIRVGDNWRLIDLPTGLMDEEQRSRVGLRANPSTKQGARRSTKRC